MSRQEVGTCAADNTTPFTDSQRSMRINRRSGEPTMTMFRFPALLDILTAELLESVVKQVASGMNVRGLWRGCVPDIESEYSNNC